MAAFLASSILLFCAMEPDLSTTSMSAKDGASFFFSGISATTASVVRRRPAMDAAFCRAVRVTFFGSTTPALTRSS